MVSTSTASSSEAARAALEEDALAAAEVAAAAAEEEEEVDDDREEAEGAGFHKSKSVLEELAPALLRQSGLCFNRLGTLPQFLPQSAQTEGLELILQMIPLHNQ